MWSDWPEPRLPSVYYRRCAVARGTTVILNAYLCYVLRARRWPIWRKLFACLNQRPMLRYGDWSHAGSRAAAPRGGKTIAMKAQKWRDTMDGPMCGG